MSTSAYLPRNAPQRARGVTFSLRISIDKSLAGSDKIKLPERVLNSITREFPRNPPNPIIFEIQPAMTVPGKPMLHCGVLEFTAPDETALIPFWMTNCLKDSTGKRVQEGSRMRFILKRSLEALKFAKFKPMDKRFARDIQTPRATLEHALRKYTALTEGQRLPIIHNGKVYPLLVESVRPSPAGHLINTNLQVEFSAPDKNASYSDMMGNEAKSDEKNGNDGNDGSDEGFDDCQDLTLYTPVSEVISKSQNVKGLYYKIKVANPNYPVRCVLDIKKGDANIYAHTNFDKPNITRYLWCNELEASKKEIYVSANDENFGTWIYVGIQAFHCDLCEFEFFVDQERNDEKEKALKSEGESGNQLGSTSDNLDGAAAQNAQKCDNCGKMISNAAYMMHSLQCARINWKCPKCEKVISRSMKDKHIHCEGSETCKEVFETASSMKRHILLRHTKIACDLCQEMFYSNEMVGHQKHECLMRSVPCKWCGMKLQFLQLKEHENYCGSLTIECELCGQSVQKRRLENHLASEHGLNPTLETNRVNKILNSNLGLDQSVNWEEREVIKNTNEKSEAKPLDSMGEVEELMDPDDKDPFVKSIKKEFAQFHSFEEEQAARDNLNNENNENNESKANNEPTNESDANNSSNNANEEENDDMFEEDNLEDEYYEFVCPYCQKHPKKTHSFADHLQTCSLNTMHEDD